MRDSYSYSHKGISFKIEKWFNGLNQNSACWYIRCNVLRDEDTSQKFNTKKQAIDISKYLIDKHLELRKIVMNLEQRISRLEEAVKDVTTIRVTYENDDYAARQQRARRYDVEIHTSMSSQNNLAITGKPKNIKKFLIASGWNPRDIEKWYPLL